ncbi:hypothetical protein N473_05630 [Pseudoalteromonas luteoviolacea CPMOR-1]|uniref:Glycosyltransferase 2-like domain-containing protein n=1 Tax=Pseudoalteromonas luteoviolacea CPMOR-1 TaxID=1365248 RepID=A0A167HK50_9GAMM|nr:glycosyltransferase family 2 protein [Pseudoalteromonas luteoviolacea]KZN58221.1 hypothetical protein N473_05630 [Pseudoalteromonas luteoviolacea CPMOR-1]
MSIKFSIIVPVYNVEDYLVSAIESLLNQTYKNFEIILVNDGSTDKSRDICREYSHKHSFIRLVEQNNQGQSVARNVGVDLAQGDAIYFFDADDLLVSNALEVWAGKFSNQEIDAVLFNASTFGDSLDSVSFRPEYSRNAHYDLVNSQDFIKSTIIDDSIYVSPCCYVVRTEIIKNLKFKPGIKHEDELYYIQLFVLNTLSITVLNEVYFERRVRPGSTMTSNIYDTRQRSYLTIFYELELCFKAREDSSKKVVLERAARCYLNSIFLEHKPKVSFNQRVNLAKLGFKLIAMGCITPKILFYFFPDIKVLKQHL